MSFFLLLLKSQSIDRSGIMMAILVLKSLNFSTFVLEHGKKDLWSDSGRESLKKKQKNCDLGQKS